MKHKNILYKTNNYDDAKRFVEETGLSNLFIDGFIENSRQDSYGNIIEKRAYEVYELIDAMERF